MKKDIIDILDIKKKDIISITGSGGKTTLMERLSQKLKKDGRVLITTSTKIKRPDEIKVDYIFDSFEEYKKPDGNNIIVAIGNIIKDKNKFGSIKEDELKKIKDDFDYILIEADGCRNLPLKMWKSYEPVIYNISNKVISVFSAKTIGKKVEKDFIYNYEEFKKQIDTDYVSEKVFLDLINSKPGPFSNFEKDKFVFINQADNEIEKSKADKIIDYLKENTVNIKYISGSILKEEYYEY